MKSLKTETISAPKIALLILIEASSKNDRDHILSVFGNFFRGGMFFLINIRPYRELKTYHQGCQMVYFQTNNWVNL
jgi:hypothetical protein